MSLYKQIRKYLLWIALFVTLLFGVHIVILYVYNDARDYPEVGGTLHIGIVGENPSIDLLAYDPRSSGNETNDMLIHFLYRGLLSYDLETGKIVEDLGNCGIDTFPTFRCTLNANAFWHEGTPISLDDVLATYDYYSKSSKNPGFQSRLEKLSVYEDAGEIVFEFDTTDISMLNLLFLPILRKTDIGTFEEMGNFARYSFSGPYVFGDRKYDNQMQVNQILLTRNAIYGDLKNVYLKNVIVSFFPTIEALESHQSRVHISLFGDQTTQQKSSDHEYHTYYRPQYYSAFVDSTRVPAALRKALITSVFPQGDELLDDTMRPMDSVFFDFIPDASETVEAYTLNQALVDLGYALGSDEKFLEEPAPPTEDDTGVSSQETETPAEVSSDTALPETPSGGVPTTALRFVRSPASTTPIFQSEPLLEISGNIPSGTQSVRVNGYVLRTFVPANGTFIYRAKPEFGNLVVGKNTYGIDFLGANSAVIDSETVEVYYSEDANQLQAYRDALTPVVETADSEEADASEQDVDTQTGVVVEEDNTQSPEDIVVAEPQTGLDASVYYNASREPASLSVAYIASSEFLTRYAAFVGEQLQNAGIQVVYQPLESDSLSQILSQDESSYDILLTGIHMGIFDYNIFPFFHSGQAKVGQNFARLRNLELDGLLEQLRDRVFYSAPDLLAKIQQDIVTILDAQFVVYPIATPFEYLAYDKKLSDVYAPEMLPSSAHLPFMVSRMSLHQGFEADISNKTFFGFFKWLITSSF